MSCISFSQQKFSLSGFRYDHKTSSKLMWDVFFKWDTKRSHINESANRTSLLPTTLATKDIKVENWSFGLNKLSTNSFPMVYFVTNCI